MGSLNWEVQGLARFMFTRCPQCGTAFRITADQLRVAAGDVRCGSCAQVFNALSQLTDAIPIESIRPTEESAKEEQSPDSISQIPTNEAGTDSDERQALEFDAPETTWSQFFIEAGPGQSIDSNDDTDDESAAGGDIALDGALEVATADPEEWRAFLEEMDPTDGSVAAWRQPPTDTSDDNERNGSAEEPHDQSQEIIMTGEYAFTMIDGVQTEAVETSDDDDEIADSPDTEFSEPAHAPENTDSEPLIFPSTAAQADEIPNDSLEAANTQAWPAEPEPSPRTLQSSGANRWLAASAVLFLTLILQLVHVYRDDLASHPRFGQALRGFYQAINRDLYPNWALDRYSVRRTEAMTGDSNAQALDIKAAIETDGPEPLGLPLVRIALRDQWANVVASRVFRPGEYLPAPLPPIVPGGTQVPVQVSVVDPGVEARGYVVDLCLPRRTGLECQLARDPFRQ